MKPPRVPDPRKLLAGLAAARADGGVSALDEQLQEVERKLQCRARQTRERRLRKLMGPPEAPAPRALSLRAMEQIRFLRSAFPEEWPAGRLAQGFGVTPEVVRRVLKSRFRPSPERGLKQDARAGARPSPAPACGAAPGALEPPADPAPPPGLSQEGAAASRARLPGLLAGGPSVAAGRRPEGARGSAGKAGKARAPRSLAKEAPGKVPKGRPPLDAAPGRGGAAASRSRPTGPPPARLRGEELPKPGWLTEDWCLWLACLGLSVGIVEAIGRPCAFV